MTWLEDGITDCLTGEDELHDIWPTCKLSHGTRRVFDNTTCNNVYLCKQGSSVHVELDQLCDGKDNCGEEASVCLASQILKLHSWDS